MRILYVNTADRACQATGGGDHVILRETARQMRELGVDVVEADTHLPDATSYDLIHAFNALIPVTAHASVRHLRSFGIPIVFSPIFWDLAEFEWGAWAVETIFANWHTPEERAPYLASVAARILEMPGPKRWTCFMDLADARVAMLREILESVSMTVCCAAAEARSLQHTTRMTSWPFRVVHHGVSSELFCRGETYEAFRAGHALPDEFVLLVGRWRDPMKNFLLLSEAVRRLGLSLVVIGTYQALDDRPNYRDFLPPGSRWIEQISQADLVEAYRAARVVAQPSWFEIPGLVAIEAAAVGRANIVVSNSATQVEYFGPGVRYCDPASVDSIAAGLQEAWDAWPFEARRRAELRRRIHRDLSWRQVAARILPVYREILRNRARTAGGRKSLVRR